jgi:hypothetical protein
MRHALESLPVFSVCQRGSATWPLLKVRTLNSACQSRRDQHHYIPTLSCEVFGDAESSRLKAACGCFVSLTKLARLFL